MTNAPTQDAVTHILPQNLEAEEAVIGAMLMSEAAIEAVEEEKLAADDFYRPTHRTIFNTIRSLARRDGSADELTVINELKHRRVLEQVGGAAAIMSLVERVPAVANVRSYINEVRSQSMLRDLVEVGHAIASLGYEHPDPAASLWQQASQLVGERLAAKESSRPVWVTLTEALSEVYDAAATASETGSRLLGPSTGFTALDRRWGGARNGALIIVAGRPGMGKSTLGDQMAEAVLLGSDVSVAKFNLEMDPLMQSSRTIARHALLPLRGVETGDLSEPQWERLASQIGELSKFGDEMYITPDVRLTVDEIRARSIRLSKDLERRGRKLGMVLVDYITLVDPGNVRGSKDENRTQQVSHVTRTLKTLALELGIPVVALSQLNRSVEQRTDKRPVMSDLRESGSIEQDADIIAFLFRLEYYLKDECPADWQDRAEVITAKCRQGQPGTDVLGWLGKYPKLLDLSSAPVRVGAVA